MFLIFNFLFTYSLRFDSLFVETMWLYFASTFVLVLFKSGSFIHLNFNISLTLSLQENSRVFANQRYYANPEYSMVWIHDHPERIPIKEQEAGFDEVSMTKFVWSCQCISVCAILPKTAVEKVVFKSKCALKVCSIWIFSSKDHVNVADDNFFYFSLDLSSSKNLSGSVSFFLLFYLSARRTSKQVSKLEISQVERCNLRL